MDYQRIPTDNRTCSYRVCFCTPRCCRKRPVSNTHQCLKNDDDDNDDDGDDNDYLVLSGSNVIL